MEESTQTKKRQKCIGKSVTIVLIKVVFLGTTHKLHQLSREARAVAGNNNILLFFPYGGWEKPSFSTQTHIKICL